VPSAASETIHPAAVSNHPTNLTEHGTKVGLMVEPNEADDIIDRPVGERHVRHSGTDFPQLARPIGAEFAGRLNTEIFEARREIGRQIAAARRHVANEAWCEFGQRLQQRHEFCVARARCELHGIIIFGRALLEDRRVALRVGKV
jgi:hypothetical protein